MTSVTTLHGINDKILSLDYKNYTTEIKTADAQKSYMDGLTVLVTGCLTGKDNLRRKYAQTFFLAPQPHGYFVLNDVFRYVEDGEQLENQPINGTDDAPRVHSIPDPDAATTIEQGHHYIAEKAYDPSDREIQSVNEKEAVVDSQPHSNWNDDSAVVESAASSALEDPPKKSYESIVSSQMKIFQLGAFLLSFLKFYSYQMKGGPEPTKIYVPTNTTKATPKKNENQSFGSVAPAPAPESSAPSSTDIPESCNPHVEVEGKQSKLGL